MAERICHIFLEAPTQRPVWIEHDDWVLDLRLNVAGDALSVDELPEGCRLIRTNVAERRFHDLARDAYVDWISKVGDRPIHEGQSLKELFEYRDKLSLWWLLPIQVKNYVRHPLPRLIQRIIWLRDNAAANAELTDVFRSPDRFFVYADGERTAQTFAQAMRRYLPDSAASIKAAALDGSQFGQANTLLSLGRAGMNQVSALWRRFKQVVGFASWSFRLPGSSDLPSRGPDVAFVTDLSSWQRSGEGHEASFVHRYLADAPARMTREGIEGVWLPLVVRFEELEGYVEVLEDSDLPVVWESARRGVSASLRAMAGLWPLQVRLARLRRRLSGHDALVFDGIDVSGWIVDELDEELRVHGLYKLQAYELIERAMSRLVPQITLYRNEFYGAGRIISAATAGSSRRWAYQHGTISRQHWVYQHEISELAAGDDFIHALPCPDIFLAYSPFVSELMTGYGFPEEKIRCIGSLRHDQMFERAAGVDSSLQARNRRALGLPEDRPLLLICAQLVEWLPDWIRLLVDGLRQSGRTAHVVVKPHWRHRDLPGIRRIFADNRWSDYSIYEGDLEPIVLAATALLTGPSTTGLEAGILGTPLIAYQIDQPWEAMPYVEDGLGLGVRDTDSMVNALEEVLSNDFAERWQQRRQQFLERHLCNIERPATEALLALLEREL